MTRFSRWEDLPYRQIWALDTEYYPGLGLAYGGRQGDPITPLSLVAVELRSGQVARRWQDELGPFPPYSLDPDTLILAYMATAEAGFHQALGWGQPAAFLDAYVEFRHVTNDARTKSSGPTARPRGFYSLPGALRHFGLEELDVAHKRDMRDRILQGPPFTPAERADVLHYNEDDAIGLARVFKRLIPLIPSIEHALFRGQYAWALAGQERRGAPIDLYDFERLRARWDDIRSDLVRSVDVAKGYNCYEIGDNGVAHFSDERLLQYAHRQGIEWPRLENDTSKPDKRAETFRMLSVAYPQVGALHELRATLAQLRNNRLSIGADARNRCLLGLYGTKTGRNAPSNSEFIFGPAKCLRFLIKPPSGMALIHRDFSQQEVRIAAVKSGDSALLAACEHGDVYLGIAEQLGFDPSCPGVRDLFKIVVLAINYGAGPQLLAAHAGLSRYEAAEIIARLRARFRVFGDWSDNIADYAGLNMVLTSELGWSVLCPPGTSARTIKNWPVQACGSEILHVSSILAERRGIRICAPIHDALLAECDARDVEDVSRALDRCMRDASAVVLRGYELPTSDDDGKGLIRPGQRYFDQRGAAMWAEINRLLAKLDRKTA